MVSSRRCNWGNKISTNPSCHTMSSCREWKKNLLGSNNFVTVFCSCGETKNLPCCANGSHIVNLEDDAEKEKTLRQWEVVRLVIIPHSHKIHLEIRQPPVWREATKIELCIQQWNWLYKTNLWVRLIVHGVSGVMTPERPNFTGSNTKF